MGQVLMETARTDYHAPSHEGYRNRGAGHGRAPSGGPYSRHRITVGADKAYDTQESVQSLRTLNAISHVAQNHTGRSSTIDGRTTRHPGYAVSQCLRT